MEITKGHRRYAAIDIGSNAARLLIKELAGVTDGNRPVLKKLILVRVPLRLGKDVFATGKISRGKRHDLLRLMKAYRQLLLVYGVDAVRACATSAMRDACNSGKIIARIRSKTGIAIEIIDGAQEARIVFNNRLECMPDTQSAVLFMDVGGGSTEINLAAGGKLVYSSSFNLGTLRMLAGKTDPCEMTRFTRRIAKLRDEYGNLALIGSGGNINKIYKLSDEKDCRRKSLPVSALEKLLEEMRPLDVEERMSRFNLRADRADVIVPAAELFLKAASAAGCSEIIVPMVGVSDGIIDGLVMRDLRDNTLSDALRGPA